jgi:hypothetical protein
VEVHHQTYGLRERVEDALEPDSWVRTSMIVWLVLIIGSDKNLLSDLWSVNLGMLPLVRTLQQTFRKKIANLRPMQQTFSEKVAICCGHTSSYVCKEIVIVYHLMENYHSLILEDTNINYHFMYHFIFCVINL